MGEYCENCGAYIPTGAKHCLSCGKTVDKCDLTHSEEKKKQKNTGVVFPPPVTYGKDGTKSVIDLRPIVCGHKADVIHIDGHFTLKDAQASVKSVSELPSPDDGTYRNILGEIITIRGDKFVKISLEIIGKLDE